MDRHDERRPGRDDHGEIHTHVHHERHEHYGGGEGGDSTAALARIEQTLTLILTKINALGGDPEQQKKLDDLITQLRQSTTGLAGVVDAQPKE